MSELRSKALQLALILGSGLLGAMVARALGLPIPFLLGSLSASAAVSLTHYGRTGKQLWFPPTLRKSFIAIIGVMIGSTFTAEALALGPSLAVTLSAMVVFIAIAQTVNTLIFQRIGGYDRITALYAAMPGGLIEAVTLGEKAGGDVETLSIQHFVRIILVIVTVPALFWLATGVTVGSAAGVTIDRGASDWHDWGLIALLVPAGMWLGTVLRLPASHLVGPLALTAGVQATGIADLHGPAGLLNLAQLVVGAGLGTNFARSTLRRLFAAFRLGVLSVGVTLAIASGFALGLSYLVPSTFEALLLSFAPGGVTEMSLVALSLGFAPIQVTTHHLFRIVFTVAVAGYLTKRLQPQRSG
ncbi:MAG: AbrB family transcriptional regulator [Pelagimonas sp.]|uniref:AbrB family transcriptional regulator n=1 Tax=Pelagimonas sp. TaxID=2073170 RepID=UPI003D6BB2CB